MSGELVLRNVEETDLPILFEHQRDPEAIRMAAFPGRPRAAFMAHWRKSMADETCRLKAIIICGKVVGDVVCWEDAGEHRVGYWLGREYWGRGFATAALSEFLNLVTVRPLHARVAKHNRASLRVLEKCGFTASGTDVSSGDDGNTVEEIVMTLHRYCCGEASQGSSTVKSGTPSNDDPAASAQGAR